MRDLSNIYYELFNFNNNHAIFVTLRNEGCYYDEVWHQDKSEIRNIQQEWIDFNNYPIERELDKQHQLKLKLKQKNLSMTKANKALLRALETKYMAYRYPSAPGHVVPFTVYTDSTANGLTRCICDFLNYSDHQAERINTMGVARTKRATCGKIVGVTWTKSTSTPGSADISSTIYGKSVKIEVKIGKDRMSEAQKRYQENIERAGGVYYVAKDFDSFVEWYNILTIKCNISDK